MEKKKWKQSHTWQRWSNIHGLHVYITNHYKVLCLSPLYKYAPIEIHYDFHNITPMATRPHVMWRRYAYDIMEWHKVDFATMTTKTTRTMWCVRACWNSLMDYLNVKYCDIWEENVTTRRDTWSKKICSLGCHDIREGVTLRRMIWQKLGCFTYNRCGSFIPYQFDYKYQSVVLSSSTWHLEAQNKLLSCFKVNDHIHHHNEPNHFNWTKHLGWFTRGPKSQVQFILASSNFWTSEKPLKYK